MTHRSEPRRLIEIFEGTSEIPLRVISDDLLGRAA